MRGLYFYKKTLKIRGIRSLTDFFTPSFELLRRSIVSPKKIEKNFITNQQNVPQGHFTVHKEGVPLTLKTSL
jgi:hypothetical protein